MYILVIDSFHLEIQFLFLSNSLLFAEILIYQSAINSNMPIFALASAYEVIIT